jgi:hypothetical protein
MKKLVGYTAIPTKRHLVVKILPLPQPPLRARTDARKKSKRPESHQTKECARARVRCLNTEPNY